MKVKCKSFFKTGANPEIFFKNWVEKLQALTRTEYKKVEIKTALGKTIVWVINEHMHAAKPIVIFPGFRTSALFWDLDNALSLLKANHRIYLVETNGQPNLSDGNSPDIKSDDYGYWASEVLDKLAIENAVIAGASFGALICLKLCIANPSKVDKAVLMNPGCLQPFSLSPKNLYYNLLPILFPGRANVERFLRNAVFYKSRHIPTDKSLSLLIEYERFALARYTDNTQKPYAMGAVELSRVQSNIHLILGNKDLLFPFQRSLDTARKHIETLRGCHILKDTGHGIETSSKAMNLLSEIVESTS